MDHSPAQTTEPNQKLDIIISNIAQEGKKI